MPLIACAAIGGASVASYIAGRASKEQPEPEEKLHWMPDVPRRGLEDLIVKVNHLGITVADVGRSVSFYVDVLGFQQIQRPNFDRHGAWLTMGNIELHLIKGIPSVPSGHDLIVSHVALDTDYPQIVLQKLIDMKVAFRQNVSVPDPAKARDNLGENFDSDEGKVTQFFVRDPDGYYYELCNCEILTKFCLFKDGFTLVEKKPTLSVRMLFKIAVLMVQARRRVRENLAKDPVLMLKTELDGITPAQTVDEGKLAALRRRQNTYSDLTQNFTEQQLAAALMKAGNQMPQAMLLLEAYSCEMGRKFVPPQYLLVGGQDKLQPRPFALGKAKAWKAPRRPSQVFQSKPFEDHPESDDHHYYASKREQEGPRMTRRRSAADGLMCFLDSMMAEVKAPESTASAVSRQSSLASLESLDLSGVIA